MTTPTPTCPPPELRDVVIYDKETRKVDELIGENLRYWNGRGSGRNSAELRLQIGLELINDHYGCKIVEAGKYKPGDVLHEKRPIE